MHEFQLAGRRLLRQPWTAATAVFALALGVGLATTMFSVLRGVVLRGLPMEDAQELMVLGHQELAFKHGGMSTPAADFGAWQEAQQSFEALGAFQASYTFVTGESGGTETWVGAYTTADSFDILGVQPQLGRGFEAADAEKGAPMVVLLGHQAWQQQFGGDPQILGRTLRVNRQEATVVGVMPAGFAFPYRQQIWMPFKVYPEIERMKVFAFGRLAEGVGRTAAQDELQALSNHLRADGPRVGDTTDQLPTAVVQPYTKAVTDPTAQRSLLMLFIAACLVLAVACANVTNLLLARGVERARELAVRSALGASRRWLLIPLLMEALLLAACGGMLGLALAFVGVRLFQTTLESSYLMAFWVDVRIDLDTILFVALAVFLSALVAGIAPAFRATRVTPAKVWGATGQGVEGGQLGWLGRALVVAQVTVSVALLVGVGIMTRSLHDFAEVTSKVTTSNLLTARLSPWQGEYADVASQRRFFHQVEERLAALPEVESVTFTNTLPFGTVGTSNFTLEGAQGDSVSARRVVASPGYFQTFGVSVLTGREFRAADGAEAAPVAVVNESFAARYFPSGSPLGYGLRQGDGAWMRIVGVVPDLTTGPFDQADPAAVYLPVAQHPQEFLRLAVRTHGDPLAVLPRLREEVLAVDRFATVYEAATMEAVLDRETWSHRMVGNLAVLMGGSTLLLAAVGLYAILAFSVRRRIHELGVRRALGARGEDLVRLVLGSGLRQVVLGLFLGLLAAVALGRMLQAFLAGVTAWDFSSFAGAAVVLVLVGLVAGWGPARWASRVDPMVALRQD